MPSDHTKTLAFIEDYRLFTALWDVNHKDYYYYYYYWYWYSALGPV